MIKQSRYYEITEGMAYIYNQPFTIKAQSMSIVPLSDLAYYRRNFALSKVWGVAP